MLSCAHRLSIPIIAVPAASVEICPMPVWRVEKDRKEDCQELLA